MHVQNCAWKVVDMQVTNNNMIEVVLKPLAAKNGLSVSVLCIVPFLWTIPFQFT